MTIIKTRKEYKHEQNKNRFNIYTFYFGQLRFFSFALPTTADNVVDRRLHSTVEPQRKKNVPSRLASTNIHMQQIRRQFPDPSPPFPSHKNKNWLHIQYVHCHSQSYVQNKHHTKDRCYFHEIKRSENKKKETTLQCASLTSCFGMCNEISSHLYIPFHILHVNWLWHDTPSCSYKNKDETKTSQQNDDTTVCSAPTCSDRKRTAFSSPQFISLHSNVHPTKSSAMPSR